MRPAVLIESPNLDVLRALAVLIVVAGHSAKFFGADPAWAEPFARSGVYLFFVHTSLVLMMSLERQERRSDDRLILGFYLRRFFRIYPLAVLAVVLVAVFAIPQKSIDGPFELASQPFHWPVFLSNLSLTMNLTGHFPMLGQLWSLPFEVQMYLVLPLLYLVARRNGWNGVLACWVAAAICGVIWTQRLAGMPGFWRLSLLRYVPAFVSGVLAYTLWRTRPKIDGRWWLPALIASLAAYLFGYGRYTGWQFTPWLLCLLVGVSIPLFRPVASRWLTAPAQQIAKYSYGIYLVHLFSLWLGFRAISASLPIQFSLWLVSLVLLPIALYHWVEAPFIRMGAAMANRFTAPRKAWAAAA